MAIDARAVSRYLSMLIERSGQTYQEIDDGSGIPKATINRLARGLTQNPQAQTVTRLVEYLGGSMDELAGIQKELQAAPPSGGDVNAIMEFTRMEHGRQIADLQDAHAAHISDMLAQHEKHVASLERRIRSQAITSIVLAVLLASVVVWFIWDLTHPEIGLIRLKQAGYIGKLIGLK